MRSYSRWVAVVAMLCLAVFLVPSSAVADPAKVSTSTQFFWGDDLLGESQAAVAQYLRFSYAPEKQKFSAAGYGRIWQDLAGGKIREDNLGTRLYYLYMDYAPTPDLSVRLGRQLINFSASSALIDGALLKIRKIGPLGISVAGGRDVIYSLDSETTRSGNCFAGIDLHLVDIKNTRLGFSYIRKYNENDLSREELGLNFRYIYKWITPYAEVKYDRLSSAVDEATVGVDLFPVHNLMIKTEFYHAYPAFDATSIYSVFAVDKFREYLVRAEYGIPKAPLSVFGEYKRQTYEDDSNADVFVVGAKVIPSDSLTLSASVDYRHAYDDKGLGFELLGDYKINNKFSAALGMQYDAYQRPDDAGRQYAQRYWFGGKWNATKNMSLSARIEDNVNETFSHRPLGRITLNWTL